MIRMALGTFVHDLGERLVQCDGDCDGVAHDLAAGILPRCMVLESQDADDRGCVVVGLNPGRCPQSERAYYLERGCTYDSVEGFWNETSSRIKYNTLVRRFLKACGLSGSVLWTELAKCESSLGASSIPPVQTLRRCTGRYLNQELAAVPGDWPVIGVGADAFRALRSWSRIVSFSDCLTQPDLAATSLACLMAIHYTTMCRERSPHF